MSQKTGEPPVVSRVEDIRPSSVEAPLTPRQVQLLRTIAEQQSREGYSPTIGELGEQLGISRTTAFEHIGQLRAKGLVSGQRGPSTKLRARSLTLTAKSRGLLKRLREWHPESGTGFQPVKNTAKMAVPQGIPLAGVVAAGQPIEAVENKDYLSINSFFGTADDVFALEVRGDSMAGAGIRQGDFVICRRTSYATDGQLVVAIVDNDNATLKRFYREPGRARLQPANDDYEPIYSENCRIEGVVIGLVRKF